MSAPMNSRSSSIAVLKLYQRSYSVGGDDGLGDSSPQKFASNQQRRM
jgi:hypothetical protein